MKAQRFVYILLTDVKVHAYSTHATALRVYERAKRVGVKVEIATAQVRKGDRYQHVKVETAEEALARIEREHGCYAYGEG